MIRAGRAQGHGGVAILDAGRVREELGRLKLTQRAFADFVDLPPETISHALQGHRVDPTTLFVIARGLVRAERIR